MPASTERPDLIACMNAYALLSVRYDASPHEIRKAYKFRAREHHPDRRSVGSTGHREATERMAAVNAAYQLVRGAPLRHHRISSGERPGNDEVDAAIRQVRISQTASKRIGVALGVLEVAIVLILLPILSTAPPAAAPLLGLALVLAALLFMAPTAAGGSIRRSLSEGQFARLSR